MKYAFAGDREISTKVLSFLIKEGHKPSAIIVGDSQSTTHAEDLIEISNLPKELILTASQLKNHETHDFLNNLDLDYIFGIHFPYIISENLLNIPKIGFLNLHPAYLPYNKGWHTPSWAILENTIYGATLHFMGKNLDEGDIIHQKSIDILPEHTANSLYQEVLDLEFVVFQEALNDLVSLRPKRLTQPSNIGTSHKKSDLGKIAEVHLDENISTEVLINKLRALTTNNIEEAAFFQKDGKKYYIQINITDADSIT